MHVTVVVPDENEVPDRGEHDTDGEASMVSDASGSGHVTGLRDGKFNGHIIVGFC